MDELFVIALVMLVLSALCINAIVEMLKVERIGTRYYKRKNISIKYSSDLDGGGMQFGQHFLKVIPMKIGKVDHAFEFCAGPGFIGFSLLAHGICKRLTLADVNSKAVGACRHTVRNNNLESSVKVYHSACLDSIPYTEKWDLVVGNPPMWFTNDMDKRLSKIRTFDYDFLIHKRFYRDIHKYLKPDGSIIMQECAWATNKNDFSDMIKDGGLQIIDVFRAPSLKYLSIYYIWSKLK